jgi:hypothetical protein
MRRFVAAVVGTICLTTAIDAQEQPWGAKFFPDGVTHDFGKVAYGAQLSHEFKITNIYNVPFVVQDARVSCGCVSVKKPSGQFSPRDKVVLEANMDTRKAAMSLQPKTVNIFVTLTSVPQNPTDKVFSSVCTLTVRCNVQSNVVFNNDRLLFGVVNLGQTPTAFVDVENRMMPSWEITGVVDHNQPVDVKYEKIQPHQGVSAYRVLATLKPNAPAGEIKYEIQLKTNDPQTPVLTVLMEGIIQSSLIASPNNIDLGNVKVGEVVTGRVILRGPQGQAFKITKVEGAGDGISLKPPAQAAPGHLLKVEFIPGKEGKVTKTLTLVTDLPGNLSTTVTIEGAGIK